MIDRYGAGSYLVDIGAVALDEDTDSLGHRRRLLFAEMPDDENLVMTEVVNSTPEPDGSYKTYYERVPPDIVTIQAALDWQWGLSPDGYRPDMET
jgi:hypothetical protein